MRYFFANHWRSVALLVLVLMGVAIAAALHRAREDGRIKIAVSGAATICKRLGAKQECPAQGSPALGEIDPWGRPYACFHSSDGMLSVGSRGKIGGEDVSIEPFEVWCVSEVLQDGRTACFCDNSRR